MTLVLTHSAITYTIGFYLSAKIAPRPNLQCSRSHIVCACSTVQFRFNLRMCFWPERTKMKAFAIEQNLVFRQLF